MLVVDLFLITPLAFLIGQSSLYFKLQEGESGSSLLGAHIITILLKGLVYCFLPFQKYPMRTLSR